MPCLIVVWIAIEVDRYADGGLRRFVDLLFIHPSVPDSMYVAEGKVPSGLVDSQHEKRTDYTEVKIVLVKMLGQGSASPIVRHPCMALRFVSNWRLVWY